MTFDEAIRYDGRLKIITTNGTCKIGYIRAVDDIDSSNNASIVFKAVDDEYTFSKKEISSIERVWQIIGGILLWIYLKRMVIVFIF